jgi:hypothetical protein
VKPNSGPRLSLVSPTHVRPGTPLIFNALGPAPLREAHYDLGRGRIGIAPLNPLQLQTDGLADGMYNVSLGAEDELGQQTTFSTTVLVDGSAPQFSEISMQPLAPAAGGSVSVEALVSDASPIRSVVLRVPGADGVATDIPMNGIDGRYNGSFQYTAGMHLVQILADDSLGNHGFAERSLDVQRKASPGLPVAALLGVFLLAVAAKRRRIPE